MNFKPLQFIFVCSLITMFKAMLLFLISPLFIGILHIMNNKLNILHIDCACGF